MHLDGSSAQKHLPPGGRQGAASKSDIANYVFINLQKYFLDADIKVLRTAHFDDKKVLSLMLRNEDDLPDDLKKSNSCSLWNHR